MSEALKTVADYMKEIERLRSNIATLIRMVRHYAPEPNHSPCTPETPCDIGCMDFHNLSEELERLRK